MRIIPAIDIIDGKCVRLTQGDYNQKKIYNEDPLEVAKEFEDNGIKYLHVVDLDGARGKKVINWKTLEKICSKTNLKVDFGGGIKTREDLELVLNVGAEQITGGSIAVKEEATFSSWIEEFGADKIILGADVKEEKVAITGWLETSNIDIYSFLEKYINRNIKNVICTDISKDGMLQGTSIDLYEKIMKQFPSLNLIASGGVSSLADLDILLKTNVDGVIIGKAIYENKFTLKELQKYVN